MTMDFTAGTCQRPEYAPAAGEPRLWDAPVLYEKSNKSEARQRQARILCMRCPALEACERYVTDMENQGHFISGVVAGRYSDVLPAAAETYQKTCSGCGKPLIPRAPKLARPSAGAVPHAGEGLCADCYPELRRNQ